MERQTSQHGHVIEVNVDVTDKICWEARCVFSDVATNTKDAREQSASMRKLLIAVAHCVVLMSIEVVGGIVANSLSILADAEHLLSDVATLSISLLSLWTAGWESNPCRSYGFFRVKILGALVSIQLIWLLAGILVYEAIVKLICDTSEVNGFLMFLAAAFGLVVNIIMALVLGQDHSHGHGHDLHDHHNHELTITTDLHHHHHEEHSGGGHHHQHDEANPKTEHHHQHFHDEHHRTSEVHAEPLLDKPKGEPEQKKQRNINVQGACLHVLRDSTESIVVMIGGAIIWYKPAWKIVDSICTLICSLIVVGTTFNMLRRILEVPMASTPWEIDATKLEKGILEMEEVVAIHELHIWAITVGKVLLTCHVKIRPEADADLVLNNVLDHIRREYNISHVTIQIEH